MVAFARLPKKKIPHYRLPSTSRRLHSAIVAAAGLETAVGVCVAHGVDGANGWMDHGEVGVDFGCLEFRFGEEEGWDLGCVGAMKADAAARTHDVDYRWAEEHDEGGVHWMRMVSDELFQWDCCRRGWMRIFFEKKSEISA